MPQNCASSGECGLSVGRSNETITLTIADSGLGIPLDVRNKVFARFFRLDTSCSRPGNGLGLALVSAITELYAIKIARHDNDPGLKIVLGFSLEA